MQTLVDELDQLIESATRVPIGGRLLIDERALRRLAEQMRSALPNQQRDSQRTASEHERILTEARTQARRIIEDAHGEAGVRLDDQAVVVAARQRARDITAEAEKSASKLRAEADEYMMNQFNMMEARLIRVLREIQAGQRALATPRAGGEPGEPAQRG